MKLFSEKKAIELTIKTLITITLMILVLIIMFPTLLNLGKSGSDGAISLSLKQDIFECEQFKNCDIKNCDDNKIECDDNEKKKWDSLVEYSKQCNILDKEGKNIECDTLQKKTLEILKLTQTSVSEVLSSLPSSLKDCTKETCDTGEYKEFSNYLVENFPKTSVITPPSSIKDCTKENCNTDEYKEFSNYLVENFPSNKNKISSLDTNSINKAIQDPFFQRNKNKFETYAKNKGIDVNSLYSIIIKEGAYNKNFENNVRFECHKFNAKSNNDVKCTFKDGKSFSTELSETNYNAYLNAKNIDSKLAFESSSFGFAQIMGFNYINLGLNIDYDSGLEKLKDENLQIEYFFKFLEKNNIINNLKDKNWQKIAQSYNGAGYAQNNYDVDLEKIYETIS